MQYEDAPSPPSRRHRRPPPPRPDRKSLPSRLKRIEREKQAEAERALVEADKGKGKAREALEVVEEMEEEVFQSTKQQQPSQTGPIASTSRSAVSTDLFDSVEELELILSALLRIGSFSFFHPHSPRTTRSRPTTSSERERS